MAGFKPVKKEPIMADLSPLGVPTSIPGATAPVLAVVDGVPTTTSIDVAKYFGKQHRHVLDAIRDLAAQLPPEALPNFRQGYYALPETGSQQHTQYILTRDGFTLLAMGFTGSKALTFKLAYIDAFNKMEAQLQQHPAPAAPALNLRDPRQLAAAALQLIEVNQELQTTIDQQQRRIEQDAPKVAALERIAADGTSLTLTQAAKLLGVKRDVLTAWLAASRWGYRQNGSWVAYQDHIHNGDLIYKEAKFVDEDGQETHKPYCHITSKGLTKLAKRHFAAAGRPAYSDSMMHGAQVQWPTLL